MPNFQWSEKVIIVTGASAGVGEATTYELAKYGAKLVLAARRENRLKKIAKNIAGQASDVLVVKTDLTQQKQIERLVRATMKRFGRIDVLINIAGLGVYSWIEKQSYKQLETQLSVNVLGGAYLASLVVPIMQRQRSGHIINMVSYASRIAVPPQTLYATTKYALEGFSDGIRRELAPWGIRVSRVHPSGIKGTEFNALAGKRGGVTFKSPGIGAVTREHVARRLRRLIQHPRHQLMIGRLYDVPQFINRHLFFLIDWFMHAWVRMKRKREFNARKSRK